MRRISRWCSRAWVTFRCTRHSLRPTRTEPCSIQRIKPKWIRHARWPKLTILRHSRESSLVIRRGFQLTWQTFADSCHRILSTGRTSTIRRARRYMGASMKGSFSEVQLARTMVAKAEFWALAPMENIWEPWSLPVRFLTRSTCARRLWQWFVTTSLPWNRSRR